MPVTGHRALIETSTTDYGLRTTDLRLQARQIEPLRILLHHPPGVEAGGRSARSSASSGSSSRRGRHRGRARRRRAPTLVPGSCRGIRHRCRPGVRALSNVSVPPIAQPISPPPRLRLVPRLDPPAIERAAIERAVGGGLHAAGAAGLVRALRRVQPDIDPLHQLARYPNVVPFEEEHPVPERPLPGHLRDPLDQQLAAIVARGAPCRRRRSAPGAWHC